jgi:signal transduction histidine kinase
MTAEAGFPPDPSAVRPRDGEGDRSSQAAARPQPAKAPGTANEVPAGAGSEPAVQPPAALQRLHAQPLQLAVLFCAAYLALDAGTDLFAVAPTRWTPWNPQAALALTLIATGGLRFAPVVAVAVLLAELLVRDAPAGAASVLSALAIAAAYSAAGFVVRSFTRWTRSEVSPRDLSALVLIALGTSLAVAVLLGLTHALAGTVALASLHVVSLQVVVGEALGLVVAAPPLLLLASGAWRAEEASTERRGHLGRDLLLLAIVIVALLLMIFELRPFDEFRLSYLLFVPMSLFAIRHGLFGASLAVPMAQLGLMAALTASQSRAATAFEYQMLILALALTSLYIGLLSSERERAARRLAARERELREQRDALNETQRTAATAELAAALAHDLNQPLSAIGTYARAARLLAERDEADRSRLFHALDQIVAASARAGQYVKRMRDFYRTGSMASERVAVEDLIGRAGAHLRDRLDRAGIVLETSIEPGLPPLRIDAVQAGAALDNLLGNACDALAHAERPRRIRVRAARLPGSRQPLLRITVQDNGPGVPEDLRPQLFKPLATTKPHGMGLGLALSRSIAERLGGGLSFDAASGVTTFHLDLPIDECRAE